MKHWNAKQALYCCIVTHSLWRKKNQGFFFSFFSFKHLCSWFWLLRGGITAFFPLQGGEMLITWKRLWLLKHQIKECWLQFFFSCACPKSPELEATGKVALQRHQGGGCWPRSRSVAARAALCAVRWDLLAEVLRFSHVVLSLQMTPWKTSEYDLGREERFSLVLIVLVILAHCSVSRHPCSNVQAE